MRTSVTVLLGCAALAACANPVSQVAGLCDVMVRIDDTLLVSAGPASAENLGPQYAVVQEDRGCQDVVESSGTIAPLANGQSSGIPAGTPLHRFEGFAANERLIAVTSNGGLMELRRLPTAP